MIPTNDYLTRAPVVGIGASAGGLEATTQVLRNLGPELPFAYVVLQHVSPTHKSLLPEILGRETRLTVRTMEHGGAPEAGVVYVVPPNSNAAIHEGRFVLVPAKPEVFPKPSINDFFISLAAEFEEAAIGLILSGTGSDGTAGLRAIMAAGGMTLVQDPATAKYDGMPRSAIEAGVADRVLKPEDVGNELGKLATVQKLIASSEEEHRIPGTLLELLQERKGVDFSGYKSGTLSRRMRRRMVATGNTTSDEYTDFVTRTPEELDVLARDILISVTAFFRDITAFDTLRSHVEELCRKSVDARSEIRVWVAGCATGEEAYSVAMLFEEALSGEETPPPVQIFATDIDEDALAFARRGLYPAAALDALGPERLERFFRPYNNAFEVGKRLRDMVVFARHNLVSDPPFLRMDLITCRNVLIYFDGDLQNRVLKRFHFALKKQGLLFLGRSESVTHSESIFLPLDRKERLFRKKNGNPATQTATSPPVAMALQHRRQRDQEIEHLLDGVVTHLNATVALCDASGNIIHTAGDVERFFQFPRGRTQIHVAEVIVEPFQAELMSMLHQLNRRSQVYLGRSREFGEDVWRLSVRPIPGRDDAHILVLLEPALKARHSGTSHLQANNENSEDELTATREHLQSLIEELATANEEMQSLNEEAQASNEELQATNEELEAANEELQATNEELMSLNEELNVKSAELLALNEEYTHVYDAIEFPIMVFDDNLRLRRFNAAASRYFGLRSTALQQHVSRVRLPEELRSLEDCLEYAAKQAEPREKLIIHHTRQLQLVVTPGLGSGRHAELLVATLVDVTEIRETESELRQYRVQLDTLMENTIVHLATKDLSGKYQYANPAFIQAYGLGDTEIEGKNDFELFPESFAGACWTNDLEAMRTGKVIVAEHTLPGSPDKVFKTVHQVLRDENGHPNLIINESEDITEWKAAAQQLQISAKVFEHAGEAIVVTDRDTVITTINQAFTRITGYTEQEAIGRKIGDLVKSGKTPKSLYAKMWHALEQDSFWQGEITNRRKNGEIFPQWLTINRVDQGRDSDHFVAVFSDITELKQSQEKAEYLATHDALTGLPNRALFQDRLDLAIAQAQRQDSMAALIFIDLDNFKNINDTLGHDIGDELLIEVSTRLGHLVRDMDTVARLGGDEFTVILPDTDFNGAERAADRIIQAMREPVIIRGKSLFVSASIGVAFYPEDGESAQSLIKAADTAMYRAKENGRDRFELFKAELQAQMQKQADLEDALRTALGSNQLRLVFQPKFTADAECRIVGAEALLRWQHPELGNIPPAEFIPVAETSGLIRDIDRKVMQLAIQAVSGWRAQGLDPVPVAVNVSGRSFQDEHFPHTLIQRLDRYRVPPSMIQLEMTERTLVDQSVTALGNIENLRLAGIRLSVDDFGTGYSSLSYLKRLPLAELKIDKSFIDGVGGLDKNDEAIARAILAMASALNLHTVAEGVETEQQQQWLAENGCDYIQGYLCARPMEHDDYSNLLMTGKHP